MRHCAENTVPRTLRREHCANWEMGFKDIDACEGQLEIDLADPKFAKQPKLLDRVFRHLVNQEFITQ